MSTTTGGNLNLHKPVVASDKISDTLTELATDMQAISDADAQNTKISGAQTVAGIKTFSSSPVVPTPTTDMQASTKKYVDDSLANKVDKVSGKGLSTEDYTTAEKTKLSGIADNANNYTHPANHAATVITEDSTHRFVTDTEKSTWDGKASASHTHDDRYFTETEVSAKLDMTDGALKSVDGVTNAKGNIDLIAGTGIQITPNNTAKTITIEATGTATPGAHAASHVSGSDQLADATTSVHGLMSASDKTKLDGVATNANNYTHPANHSPSIITQDSSNRFVTDTEKSTWNGKADSGHNHAGTYSPVGHNHSGTYEPANANIQTHVTSSHAPSNAQKNSDILKSEIEAVLTGEISSHSHSGSSGGTGLFEYNLVGGM